MSGLLGSSSLGHGIDQGETDKDGKPDGRGIFIRPEDQVVFVHFKKSVLHGRALVFFSTGQKEIGSFKTDPSKTTRSTVKSS